MYELYKLAWLFVEAVLKKLGSATADAASEEIDRDEAQKDTSQPVVVPADEIGLPPALGEEAEQGPQRSNEPGPATS
jgi:hypothetical protein